jgi:hypothetical protein
MEYITRFVGHFNGNNSFEWKILITQYFLNVSSFTI